MLLQALFWISISLIKNLDQGKNTTKFKMKRELVDGEKAKNKLRKKKLLNETN